MNATRVSHSTPRETAGLTDEVGRFDIVICLSSVYGQAAIGAPEMKR